MATRLFSDIRDASGRRYYFDLDSAPGIAQPGLASLSFLGYQIFFPDLIFRTPAPAALSLSGLLVGQGIPLSPTQAALTLSGQIAGLQTELTIRLGLFSPVENPPADFAPTIVYINTITPAPAALSLIGYNHSLSQGGNIGFLFPPTAALTLSGYQVIRNLPPEESTALPLAGLTPFLQLELVCTPEVGALSAPPMPQDIEKGFIWIDVDPAPTVSWT